MKNKYLILAGENTKEKVSNVNFLFPLKGFCVGVKKEYELEECDENSYVYINRILDKEAITKFEELLPGIEEKAKGIVFEDLGVLEVLKERHSKLETILYASHAACSSFTVNAYLNEVDTVILSPDITEGEIRIIETKVSKPIGVVIYGHIPYMYSRRHLLTHYARNFAIEKKNPLIIKETIHQGEFLCVENEFGTVLYDKKAFDGRALLDLNSVSYFFMNLEFMEIEHLSDWLVSFEKNNSLEDTTTGFLEQKTIYRLPPRSVEK